jgi:hypothetical protein
MIFMNNTFRTILIISFLLFSRYLAAQTQVPALTQSEKKQVIDSAVHLLKTRYVLPETGSRLAAYLADKFRSGAYNAISDPSAFADTLTEQLFAASKDQHFRVFFDPAWVTDSKIAVSPSDSLLLRSKRAEQHRAENYGFKELRNLGGNIGYLKLTGFIDPLKAGPTVVAAMNTLSNSDALIIDIRDNPGGFGQSVDLISSYLFDESHDFALPFVPGNRMPAIPVFLLISRFTYSAAEGFAQLLKLQKRATLIGENTGGAAHGIELTALSGRFYIHMPHTRPNPDWEGTGIAPDIKEPPAKAYSAAIVQALQDLAKLHPENKANYQWLLEDEAASQNPVTVGPGLLKTYTGNYGPRKVYVDSGQLYYHREGDIPYLLLPLSNDLFRFAGTDDIRIRFVSVNGKVNSMQIIYRDGTSKMVQKDK